MAVIAHVKNSFDFKKGVERSIHPGGVSVREWLEEKYPGFVEFEQATVCWINSRPVLRREWKTYVIQQKDVVIFQTVIGGPFLIIVAIILIVVVLLTVFLTRPVTPGQLPASDPVYSTRGQQNTIRLGEPIETCYGRNRIYPSLASVPFFKYINNDQFQYALFCLGQGEYEIEVIQIADTPIGSFQEVEYEVVQPNDPVTLIPTNVQTAPEVGSQTLLAPNEAAYVPDGWVGPFPASQAGTTVDKIEVDFVYPRGLYNQNSKGKILSVGIEVEIEIRQIDNAGVPIGGFIPLPSVSPFILEAATTTPQRRTLSADVTPARYEVRARRTDDKVLSDRAGHEVTWESLKGFVVGTSAVFGDLTLLAVKIRATNNLNNQTAAQFNAIATRKIPVYSPSTGWAVQATRSIAWAFADVFRAKYGGRIPADSYLDLAKLVSLDSLFSGRGEYFDYCFRDAITVWEAAQTISQVGRGLPLLIGALISLQRDGPADVPVTMFNSENIAAGSFEWDVKLWAVDEFDSLEVEYTEPSTGYKQETVVATLPGGTSDNPDQVRLVGCQNRTHAYRWGLYKLAVARYQRENATFSTGLEGQMILFGDLVACVNDVPRWGQGGIVLAAELQSHGLYSVVLSEELVWDAGEHFIAFRGPEAEILGPYSATKDDSDPMRAFVSIGSDGFDFLLDGETEPMLFYFGVAGSETKLCKVVRMEPSGKEEVKVTVVNYASEIYSFDELTPPPIGTSPLPLPAPDLPSISTLYVSQKVGVTSVALISWTPAFGAQYYVVQTSTDGENWAERGTVTQSSIQLPVDPGDLWVRVAAVNKGQGPWISQQVDVAILSSLEISEPWADLEWAVQWWKVLNSIGYVVKVYDASATDLVLKRTTNLTELERTFSYDAADAESDGNLVRHMVVEVDALFDDGPTGSPASLDLKNAIPSPPTGMGYELLTVSSNHVTYRLFWDVPHEGDLITVKVWLSPDPDFDPGTLSPAYSNTLGSPAWEDIPTETNLDVSLDSFGTHDAMYWRVALFDVWGNELASNVSSLQNIPAYP